MPRLRRFLALAALLTYVAFAPAPVAGISNSVVISQVYGGGGNSGATYKNDFIELHNRGNSPVSLSGWSVQYAAAAGTTWQRTNLTAVTLQPGQYYLIQEAQGAGGAVNLPTPDAPGAIAMSATAGKVALVNNQTTLTGTGCPFGAAVIDFVGFGSTANCFEGTGPTGTLSNTTAALRGDFGCTDTDQNSVDFVIGVPTPHNTLSPPGCSFPTGTGSAAPEVVPEGGSVTLTVVATPGSNPTNTNFTVTGDLTSIGGSATASFAAVGAPTPAGEQTFAFTSIIGAAITQGPKTIPISIIDGLSRPAATTITLAVKPAFITHIHDIQGHESMSPLANQLVSTEGIVTARRSNGFFIQDLEANYDVDVNTSEGVFVFTSGVPPSAAAVGNLVFVIGTVSEFIPSQDPYSPATTELVNPFVATEATGATLPTPVELTPADLDAGGSVEQLEHLEGMRVSMASATVVAPTGGTQTESLGTSTSSGVFYVVLPGIDRPFREAGIEVFEPVPPDALSPATVTRFDANPERVRVDSDAVGGTPLDVTPGQTVTNLVGPLDYSFRSYTIDLEPASPPIVSGAPLTSAAVRVAAPGEFTIGTANLERFFDTTDDADTSDAVLISEAFANRLNKVSLQIRTIMRLPDIIGVEEVEHETTLQAIAAKVNSDTVSAGGPDPGYVAYLEEGNDIGGIDSGFLVKSSRVTAIDVTQEGLTTQFMQPDGMLAVLNDRPPLVLRAFIHQTVDDAGLPVTVIVNHLRSLSSINSATDGARVRAKRKAQAEFLANLIQTRQSANPSELIVSVGDYNAFQFSDGYVDAIGTIKGTPTPPELVTLASDDLVNPNLVDLVDTVPADQRYSFVFDGNAQELDHVIVTPNLFTLSNGLSYGRNNADFPEALRSDPNTPLRISDHDPLVAYFAFPVPTNTTVSAIPDPAHLAQDITFTAAVTATRSVTSGSVEFSDGVGYSASVAVSNGQASVTVPASAFGVGSHTMSASYTDGGALTPSSGSVTFDVIDNYPFSGFLAPVDNLPALNQVKAGAAVPVKFSLGGNLGLNIFTTGYPRSETVPCDTSSMANGIDETVTAGNSSLSFDEASGQYSYIWKTDKAWAGSCRQFVVKLTDGTVQRADFKFAR